MVIINPITNEAINSNGKFFLLVNADPAFSPIGIIPISAPSKNNANPMIVNNELTINVNVIPSPKGVIVQFKIRTISAIGPIDTNVSLIFSNNFYSPNFTQTILIFNVSHGRLIIAKREFSKKNSRWIQNYKDVILYPLALIAFFFDSSHPFSSPAFCSL